MKGLSQTWNDPSKALQFNAFLRLGIQILLGIIPVKIGYAVNETSQLELYLFYGAALSFFTTSALNKTLLTNNAEKSEFTVLLSSVVLAFGSAILAFFIANKVNGLSPLLLSGLVLTLPLANSIEHFILIHRKIKALYSFSLIYATLYLIVICLLFFNQRSISEVISAIIGIHLLKSLLVLVFAKARRPLNFQSDLFQTYMSFMGIALLGGLMNYLDGFILNYLYPEYPFSVFRYGARELPFLNIIFTSLAAGFILIIQKQTDWASQMKKRLHILLLWSFPFVGILFFISPYAYEWAFSPEYRISATFFNIYLLMLLFRVMIGQSILMAYRKEKVLLFLSGIELIGNIVLSIILGIIWGVFGIMSATVLAYAIHKILLLIYLKRKMSLRIGNFFPVKSYIALASILILSFYLSWEINIGEIWP